MRGRRSKSRWLLTLTPALTLVVAIGAYGQTEPREAAQAPPAEAAGPQAGPPADKDKEKKDEFPKFEEFAKDHKEVLGPQGVSGFFQLHYNAEKDSLLMVVPKGMIGQNFLLASSITGGPQLTNFMWDAGVVQWQEFNKKLVLVAPELRFPTDGKSAVQDVVKRTYTDTILSSLPIVAKKGADPVIDLGSLFKKDFSGISRLYGGSLDGSLSQWAKYKTFPNNLVVAVDAVIKQGPAGAVKAQVGYTMVKLPNNDYKPRLADDRIGYFLTVLRDWGVDHNAHTTFKRYVNRWDVRKAEPGKAVSDADPEHQIVFYIEKTVPVKYRRYVREGILEWNKAFEKAGIRNAVRVEQQTDEVHADKDPEDVRYSFVRWIVSGRAFAMGPSLAHPMTGQILDADIIFDDSMARNWELQYARFSATGLGFHNDPELERFLTEHPEWQFKPQQEVLLPDSTRYSGAQHDHEFEPPTGGQIPSPFGRPLHRDHQCDLAVGLAHEFAFNSALLSATGSPITSEEFVGQFIKYVTTHEVGHTLGLRHNFKASSWKPVTEILSETNPQNATAGSVMDYNAGLFNPDAASQGLFVIQTVGPYDEWAIAYGYGSPDGETHKDEKSLLDSITTRVTEAGLAYASDEDTSFFSPDPTVNRWDMGADLLDYSRHRMDMIRRMQKDMAGWAVKEGESYQRLRAAFEMALNEYARSAQYAARYIGGQYVHRYHKGDSADVTPITVVPAAKQRETLQFLSETVFSDKDFQFDPELLNRLAPGRWGHWNSDAYDSQLDYPIHDRIAAVQYNSLFQVLNPVTLERIHDAEVKVAADQDALTIPELLGKMTDTVWSELGNPVSGAYTTRKPFCSSIRRNLQRQHLQVMLNLILAEPGGNIRADIHSVACLNVKRLSDKIATVISKGDALDEFTRAHLEEAKSRIDRALDAQFNM